MFVLFKRQPDPEITQIIWLYINIDRQTVHAQRTLKMCNNYFGLLGIFIFDLNQLKFQLNSIYSMQLNLNSKQDIKGWKKKGPKTVNFRESTLGKAHLRFSLQGGE